MIDNTEESGELLPVDEEQEMALAEIDETQDPQLAVSINLPTFTDVTDKQVLKNVRDVFKGFEPDTSSNIRFQELGSLATYAKNSINDIKNVCQTAEANQLCYKAAASARFWYLGQTIEKSLNEGKYGDKAVQKLAAQAGFAASYIYQIKDVAKRLTVTDCYLLGFRNVDTTQLRKLAQIKDDAVRRSIIDAFIEVYHNTADSKAIDSAKASLKAAVNAALQNNKTRDVAAMTSDPMNGGSEIKVSVEYTEAMKFLTSVGKNAKALAEDQLSEDAVRAFDYFNLSPDVPDADKHLEEIHTKAEELEKRLRLVVENCNAMIESLVVLKGVELDPK